MREYKNNPSSVKVVSNTMPGIVTQGNETDGQTTVPKKLVLCFDGTGNTFTGSSSDTNVVKILRKFDRNAPDQFHYYQS